MSGLCEESSLGSGSFIETINNFTCELFTLVFTTLGITSNVSISVNHGVEPLQNFTDLYQGFLNWLSFDDFQLQLLKVFLFVLVSNVALIYIAWHIYGARISERFMKPANSAAVEELRRSVSQLKLPTEHSPRL